MTRMSPGGSASSCNRLSRKVIISHRLRPRPRTSNAPPQTQTCPRAHHGRTLVYLDMHWFMHDAPRGEFGEQMLKFLRREKTPFALDHCTRFGRRNALVVQMSCNELTEMGLLFPSPSCCRADFAMHRDPGHVSRARAQRECPCAPPCKGQPRS